MEKLESRFLKQVKADTQDNDADMGTEAKKFYQDYFPKSINSERGETWFTPIALIDNIYKVWSKIENDVLKYSYYKDGPSQLKQYKLELIGAISNKICGGNINIDYHCLANFGCLPSALNAWRGREDLESKREKKPIRLYEFNRSRLGDFPDLLFVAIKCYLTKRFEDGYDPKIEGEKLLEFEWWFKQFRDDNKCAWENFVDKMHLKGNFVDDNYKVIKLFTHSIGNPFPNLQGITSISLSQNNTVEELSALLSENEQIKKCIENIYDIWYKRAKHFESLDISSIESE